MKPIKNLYFFLCTGKIRYTVFAFVLLSLAACEKKETPFVLPSKPVDSVRISQFDLGEKYENQIFVNFLDSNPIRANINGDSWDLSFDCSPGGYRVYMNGGKGNLLAAIGVHKFRPDVNMNNVMWRWDESSGGDSIVLNRWCNPIQSYSFDSVYLIDRGIDANPDRRYFQFKLKPETFNTYIIDVADLNGVWLYSTKIIKDPSKNLVYFDFGKPAILNFEPCNQSWHFCFLRYRYIYYQFNPPLLYYVTGIHINPRTVCVAIDSSLVFENIKLTQVEELNYSSRRDAMGFDWKVYDFTKGKYIARRYVNFILKTKGPNPQYYKLRFTDFYSNHGVKGSPKYELARIK